MNHPSEPDDDLTAALQRLPRELEPPAHVRSNVGSHVRSHGRSNAGSYVWRAAVAASLVAVAFAAGRITAPRATVSPAEGQKFAFLLYGGPTGGGDDRAAEYGAWAVEARRQGRPVSGERLADAAWFAGAAIADPLPLRGFFIVRARDSAEALDLARRHPHARDGTVVIRPIDTP
jgi:hypothetical protein